MIFDVHARLVRRPRAVGRLLRAMDRSGIARAAVSPGGLVDLDRLSHQIVHGGRSRVRADHDWLLRACAAGHGRLRPFFFADPFRDADAYRAAAGLFDGLEISPAVHGFPLRDPAVSALLSTAAAAGHPVYVVCLGRTGTRTSDLVALARSHPRVAFVLGHCGSTALDADSLRRIAPYRNILVETSGCFAALVPLALRRLGPDRVLFGSEYPLQDPAVELAKFASLSLPRPVWRAIAWHNADRILRRGDDR